MNLLSVIARSFLSVIVFSHPVMSTNANAATIVAHEESNNIPQDAYPVLVNDAEKSYAFDYGGDEDWFVFYAHKNIPYEIQIPDKSVGKGINPVIDVYDAAGNLEVGGFDFGFAGEGELLSWNKVPQDGFYYIKVTNAEKQFSTTAHRYGLKIFIPFLEQNIYVEGSVINQCNGLPIARASVKALPSPNEELTSKQGLFQTAINPGRYDITASAAGFEEQSQQVVENRKQEEPIFITLKPFVLSPKAGCQIPPPIDEALLKQRAVAVYDENTHSLSIKDVRIGGTQIIAAELEDQGGFNFKLIKAQVLSSALSTAPAYYDFDSSRADIPQVFAFKSLWAIKMRGIGNDLYVIEGSPEMLPVQ